MKQLISIMLLLAVMQTGRAQVAGTPYIGYSQGLGSTMGTDFWLTFTNNYNTADVGSRGNGATVSLLLTIATDLPNTVTISFTADSVAGAPRSFTYNLAAGESRRIELDSMGSDGSTDATIDERANVYLGTAIGLSASGVLNNTMHVTSVQPIAVYLFNVNNATTDATCVYPVPTWGTEYRPISYSSNFQPAEVVIANQDGTNIFINGSTTPTATLKAGQLYIVQGNAADDFTGRRFTSSKPVAYFAARAGLNVGSQFNDMLQEQMVSVDKWDKQYFVPNVPQFRTSSIPTPGGIFINGSNIVLTNNHIRIVASQDNTQVNYTGAALAGGGGVQIASGGTLNAGQYAELIISNKDSGTYITANKPIGVADYLVGGDTNPNNLDGTTSTSGTSGLSNKVSGDPDNAVIPGLEQLIQQITISPFIFPLSTTIDTRLAYTNFDGVQNGGINTATPIHSAIILTPKANKGNVVMTKGTDPTNLLTGTWIDDANGSGMSIYRYVFDNVNDIGSSFTIKSLLSGVGIFVLSYGLANYESYFYNAGSGLKGL